MNLALTQAVRALAQGLGFDACGIASVYDLRSRADRPAAQAYRNFLNWLGSGKQADMTYLSATAELRANPQTVLPEARSMVVVLQSYFHTRRFCSSIAQYAWGKDYHIQMRRRLQILADYLIRQGFAARPFVDTAPILEKAWAVEAGLGWIGKNTLLISRRLGSFTFIGGVLTTAPLYPDEPFLEDFCGSCQRCIEACPTGALSPYVLDATRCIAYWTIEAPTLPEELQPTHGWIFGCDICQIVCPWNRFARPQGEFQPQAAAFYSLQEWASLSPSQVKRLQQGSALRRTRPLKLQRLAQAALTHKRVAVVGGRKEVLFDGPGAYPAEEVPR
ncbi:MAG: tRNA epoxyqueuosine(34) reductase QueG [Bacteroidia bacterium]|nr:tRNA epoxyqueuosine(34) reductase QueG [Bacteroidia bacterium]MDW8089458.1 tRNA epoxyqueuosine(34) reductase QueG [Bacteroidia bacterium]